MVVYRTEKDAQDCCIQIVLDLAYIRFHARPQHSRERPGEHQALRSRVIKDSDTDNTHYGAETTVQKVLFLPPRRVHLCPHIASLPGCHANLRLQTRIPPIFRIHQRKELKLANCRKSDFQIPALSVSKE